MGFNSQEFSYSLNVEAYELFIKLEVGLREFLIKTIQNVGVHDWTKSFLGEAQKETIAKVFKRITEAYSEQKEPKIDDLYIYKLGRAKKEQVLLSVKFYHPFYYLNWNDIENLMRLKQNAKIIDEIIGIINREIIVDTLHPLTSLRNDIAHSRFIDQSKLIIIKSSYDKITALIPDFESLIYNQSAEPTLDILIADLKNQLTKLFKSNVLSVEEIIQIKNTLQCCENSFWLNSENLDLVKYIVELRRLLEKYHLLRVKQGGLLEIQKLKLTITKVIQNINENLNGKI